MGPKFFQTIMGRKFYESDIPRLIRTLERIATALEAKAKPAGDSNKIMEGAADTAMRFNTDLQRQAADLMAAGLKEAKAAGGVVDEFDEPIDVQITPKGLAYLRKHDNAYAQKRAYEEEYEELVEKANVLTAISDAASDEESRLILEVAIRAGVYWECSQCSWMNLTARCPTHCEECGLSRPISDQGETT